MNKILQYMNTMLCPRTPMSVCVFSLKSAPNKRHDNTLGAIIQSQKLGVLPTLTPRVGSFKLQLQRRRET